MARPAELHADHGLVTYDRAFTRESPVRLRTFGVALQTPVSAFDAKSQTDAWTYPRVFRIKLTRRELLTHTVKFTRRATNWIWFVQVLVTFIHTSIIIT